MAIVGVGKTDITPRIGVDLTGYVAREGGSQRILDPLFAKALFLEIGHDHLLFIALDILALGEDLIGAIKDDLHDRLHVPRENVVICATHTHSGPAAIDLRGCGSPDREWLEALPGRIRDAACQAVASATVAHLVFTQFRTAVSRNRRMGGGPVDDRGSILQARDADGQVVATLVSFACHPVVLRADNHSVSADYPGRLTADVESRFGGVCLFLAGAAGDVEPHHVGTEADMQTLAAELTRSAIDALGAGRMLAEEMRVRSAIVELPSEDLPQDPEEVERKIEQELGAMHDGPLRNRVREVYRRWADEVTALSRRGIRSVRYRLSITVARIGTTVFVFLSGEPLALLGLHITEVCAPLTAVVVGYANGCVGYLPARSAYRDGGYEIEVAHRYYGVAAPISRGAEHSILETVKNLIAS
jgi:hypothetical protein